MNIFSVNDLTNFLKDLIENEKSLQNIWVKGEVSNVRRVDSHCYFTLKDNFSVIDCVVFSRIHDKLDIRLVEGMQIMVRGSIEIYRKRGSYQIIAEEITISGKGELYADFLKTKEALEKEGLFRNEYKKSLPEFPQVIGIITSLEGAALHDMLKVFRKKIASQLYIVPTLVQGEKAKNSIMQGIRCLNKIQVDLIIVARGGGSFEDLNIFNDEFIAREIFNSRIPIITGIGHESDFTIADFVADIRAATPTAAAEIALPDKNLYENKIELLQKKLYTYMKNIIEKNKQIIIRAEEKNREKIIMNKIQEYQQNVDEKYLQLVKTMRRFIEVQKKYIQQREQLLFNLNPLTVLERGYSITMQNNMIVSSVDDIEENTMLVNIFKDGIAHSKVINKSKNEQNI